MSLSRWTPLIIFSYLFILLQEDTNTTMTQELCIIHYFDHILVIYTCKGQLYDMDIEQTQHKDKCCDCDLATSFEKALIFMENFNKVVTNTQT